MSIPPTNNNPTFGMSLFLTRTLDAGSEKHYTREADMRHADEDTIPFAVRGHSSAGAVREAYVGRAAKLHAHLLRKRLESKQPGAYMDGHQAVITPDTLDRLIIDGSRLNSAEIDRREATIDLADH
ncbi:MAG: hypothetical protein AB7P76_08380 [Candidatus Melainabacteria bacterium]